MATQPWISTHDNDHELVGRIWHTATARFVAPAELSLALAGADFVVLGEMHEQPDHHRLQAEALRDLVARGRRPALLLEMLTPDQEPKLAAFLATKPRDALGLGPAVDWLAGGWPDWAMYAPIAQVALDANLPMAAANLPRPLARAIAKGGLTALDPATRERLGLDLAFDVTIADAMAEEVIASHCGQLPKAAAAPMALAQRARDAAMADALLRAATTSGAVLIAGNGHARSDRGVPYWLRLRAPGRGAVSLGFVEVQPGMDAATAAQALATDYLYFTPRLDDTDPCVEFRKQLEELRRKSGPAPTGS